TCALPIFGKGQGSLGSLLPASRRSALDAGHHRSDPPFSTPRQQSAVCGLSSPARTEEPSVPWSGNRSATAPAVGGPSFAERHERLRLPARSHRGPRSKPV